MDSRRRTDALLLLGMVAGAALAAASLMNNRLESTKAMVLRGADGSVVARNDAPLAVGAEGSAGSGDDTGSAPRSASAEGDSVALVGDGRISRVAYQSALELVERDRRRPLDSEESDQILARLIDEELLFQRAMALGLAGVDRKLRADLVSAMIVAATAEAGAIEPTTDQLRDFFEEQRALFVGPAAVRVAQIFVAARPGEEGMARSRTRAGSAAERLRAGEEVAVVRGELGDPPAVEIPATLLPGNRLRDFVGPTAANAALGLAVGEVSEPVPGPDGYRILLLVDREDASGSTFEEKRADVLAEYRRQSGEVAMRQYLDTLRSATEITDLRTGSNGRP